MKPGLSSRERIKLALKHQEPDRVPFDLGSTSATGMHAIAYENLLRFLHLDKEIEIADMMQQMAQIDEEVLDQFRVDTRGLSPNLPSISSAGLEQDDRYMYFRDRWGILYEKPIKGGFYYDMVDHPLKGEISTQSIDQFKLPDHTAISGRLIEKVKAWESAVNPPAIVLEATEGGLLEIASWLRGWKGFYRDLAVDQKLACYLIDKILEFKMQCWEMALKAIGRHVLIAWESDDLGIQTGPMFSPSFYRTHIKPRHKKLFSFIKKSVAPQELHVALHSCGSIYEFIPDFIEIGVDAINPVQVSAAKMDTKQLKREFGRDITFWGGGIDTQRVLPRGTVQEVRQEVHRRLEDLAPGGGFIFSAVHNIQPDVPPQNIMAMWEAFEERCAY